MSGVQTAVDQYLQLHAESKAIEKRLAELKLIIEPYMDTNKLTELAGTEGGLLRHTMTNRAVTTSAYTTYEVSDVAPLVSKSMLNRIVVPRIHKDFLEALVKTGDVPQKALELKITVPSRSLTVKR